jgi:hypothetical protein
MEVICIVDSLNESFEVVDYIFPVHCQLVCLFIPPPKTFVISGLKVLQLKIGQ